MKLRASAQQWHLIRNNLLTGIHGNLMQIIALVHYAKGHLVPNLTKLSVKYSAKILLTPSVQQNTLEKICLLTTARGNSERTIKGILWYNKVELTSSWIACWCSSIASFWTLRKRSHGHPFLGSVLANFFFLSPFQTCSLRIQISFCGKDYTI